MRQRYFDLGASHGLGDDVFRRSSAATAPDIPVIGISNPPGLSFFSALDQLVLQVATSRATFIQDSSPSALMGQNIDPTGKETFFRKTRKNVNVFWTGIFAGREKKSAHHCRVLPGK